MKTKLPPRTPGEHAKRPRCKLTLGQYVDRYLESRDVSEAYERLLRSRIGVFIEWYGSDPPIATIDCDIVNEFINGLLATELAKVTVDNYRRAIRCVWMFAHMEGDTDNVPSRLKKVRVKREHGIEAFSHEEIAKLLSAARKLPGYFPNGAKRSLFWQTAIHAAYSTGLRRGDLLRLRASHIGEDGTAVLVMHKTGFSIAVQLSPEAIEGIREMQPIVDDAAAIPWPYHENALPRQFRSLVKAAGVRPGPWKWLRRSAGSYAEAAQPGAGSRLLGHRSLAVFNGHYNCQEITVGKPIAPPAIGGVA